MSAPATPSFTFDEAGHVYREDGLVRLSVTQVLRAEGFLNWLDKIPAHILERKRQLGTLVHQATALWDQGEDLTAYNIPEEIVPYLEGYMNFCDDCSFEPDPQFVEYRMIAQLLGMRYGMTLDVRGFINGKRYTIERKCGASEDPAWGIQLAAYDSGVNDTHGRPRDARAAVQLGPQFKRNYKFHPYEDASDYVVWANSLANTIWKLNKKIYSPEAVPERVAA
jgi:hypothetical protein